MRNSPGNPATTGLARAARAGDSAAVSQLLTAHLPLIYNLVGRALNGHADVDDVVQDCLVRIIRGLPDLRDPDRFTSWVVSIAYRQIQDHWRGRRRAEVPLHERGQDLPDPTGDFADRTVAELLLTGQRRQLAEATRWLDVDNRQLMALWWQEATGELSRPDVVAALGTSEGHVAVRLHRMRTQLDSARAVVAALRHRPRCPELTILTRSWDGTTTGLWRKRFTRHVRTCQFCAAMSRELVPPEQLLTGLTAVAVPVGVAAALRAAVEAELVTPGTLTAGQGAAESYAGKTIVAGAAAVVSVVVLALAVLVAPGDRGDGVAAPPARSPSATTAGRPTPSPTGPSPAPTSRPPGTTRGVASADIIVAPDGSDSGDGSLTRPFATLNRAVEVVRPGQTIAMRAGTYRLTRPVKITTSGTAGRRIVLSAYRNEPVILDAAGLPASEWAVHQQTGFWTVQDLEVRGSRSHAWVCSACSYTIFQRLSMHDNARSGLTLRDLGTVGNKVLDSDFFRNYDPADNGGAGIGLGVKFGAGQGNVLRGNRAFHNADDGFDFGAFDSPLTVEGNWSYGNGLNRWRVPDWDSNGYGFSLGGGPTTTRSGHRLRDNAAWGNRGHGFGAEANRGNLSLSLNTAFDNGGAGFDLPDARGVARENLAVDNKTPVNLGSAVDSAGNSWDGGRWTRSAFRSTNPSIAEGARPPDGRLPSTDYLRTRDGIGARMFPA
ncbi:sigma-70 family RNA polymerase sigma factor [Micromonospora citrea]|uniref:sigma-70 family RNA polymerase sigma factor n=1 Tax=Micromonospora citrea TaxID=47855 RepID=UPI003C4B2398